MRLVVGCASESTDIGFLPFIGGRGEITQISGTSLQIVISQGTVTNDTPAGDDESFCWPWIARQGRARNGANQNSIQGA
ncbi:unannotated protein [freshwater metagenome]|uniref:Unannotated protein n=1 Tax=freshwater metagenome TaxID=449393 RepID=A0A6J7LEF1_9ZZZZ